MIRASMRITGIFKKAAVREEIVEEDEESSDDDEYAQHMKSIQSKGSVKSK